MVRRSSRSRSRGREAPQAVPPKQTKSPRIPKVAEGSALKFTVDSTVMARWPGSKLFYTAQVLQVQGGEGQYEVRFENGSVFTVVAKDVYGQNSVAFRKAVNTARSKSKSRARSSGRGKKPKVTPKKAEAAESGADKSLEMQLTRKSSSSSHVSKLSASPAVSPEVSHTARPVKASLTEALSGDDMSPSLEGRTSVSSRVSKRTKVFKTSNKSVTDTFSEDDDDDLALLSASARASRSSLVPQVNGKEFELATDQTEVLDQAELSLCAASDRPSLSSKISSMLFGTLGPAKTSTASKEAIPSLADLEAISEDEADDSPSSASAIALGSSKKSSRTLRASVASKKASASSKIEHNTEEEEEANIRPAIDASIDITEKVDKLDQETVPDKTSISSRISSMLFGETSKASTSSKVDLEEVRKSAVEDLTTEKESSFSYVSARRSSRISTKSRSVPTNTSTDPADESRRSVGLDEFSDDEEKPEVVAEAASEEKADPGWRSMEWVWAVCFMALCPGILVWLHSVCTADICSLAVPNLSLDPRDYWDSEAVVMLLSFVLLLRALEFLCMGKEVQGYRMNGFQSLLLVLCLVPILVYHGFPLTTVTTKYFHLLCSAILLSYLQALFSLVLSYRAEPDKLSTKGNTGNPLVNLFHGRELNPSLGGANIKLQTFRCSMIGLAVLNTVLVWDSSIGRAVSPTVVIAAAFQVLYAMDAMYYEECYFYSHDSLHSGYGWSLISSYLTFPFLPTLVTKHLVAASPSLPLPALAAIAATNLLGYCIYRGSENQRCQLARDPTHPSLAHLETLETIKGRRLIVSGWWGLVRHPNYLGELLVQWSWVLPAVPTLGLSQLVPYYLPAVTTLMLVLRCVQINKRNSRKFGGAWAEYTGRVKSNIVPRVF